MGNSGAAKLGPKWRAPAGSVRVSIEILAKVYRLASILGWFLNGYVDVVQTVQGSHPTGFGAQMRQALPKLASSETSASIVITCRLSRRKAFALPLRSGVKGCV